MGTSKSYGGPTDAAQRLLPAWALPQGAAGGAEPAGTPDGGDDAPVVPAESESPGEEGDASPVSTGAVAPSQPQPRPWQSAKSSLTRAIHDVNTGGRSYGRAARNYVHARGGSGRAGSAAAASSGRVTARFGGFLAGLASAGLAGAEKALGLAPLAGRSPTEVFAEITNAIAPAGATMEDGVARRAAADALAALYERKGVEEGGIERLATLSPADVTEGVLDSVNNYIFYRWTQELGLAIERGAVSAAEAVAVEAEMRSYIRDTVKVDLSGRDVLTIDWAGNEGQLFIEGVYQQAFRLIEAST